MNKWFIDTFLEVETILFNTPSEIINGLSLHKPDVFIFGDFRNCFTNEENSKILEILKKNKTHLLIYGGWQGFGLGSYKDTYIENELSLDFVNDELQMVIYKISETENNNLKSAR